MFYYYDCAFLLLYLKIDFLRMNWTEKQTNNWFFADEWETN